jgi:hypothetical protein
VFSINQIVTPFGRKIFSKNGAKDFFTNTHIPRPGMYKETQPKIPVPNSVK